MNKIRAVSILFIMVLASCSRHGIVEWYQGDWKVEETIRLYSPPHTSTSVSKLLDGSLYVDDTNITYSLNADVACQIEGIYFDTITIPEEGTVDLNLRATSWWYGFRSDRPHIDLLTLKCRNSSITFEILSRDTLGYLYNGYLYILTKQS